AAPGPDDEPAAGAAIQRDRMVGSFLRLFADCVGRALKREKRTAAAMRAIFAPAITAMAEGQVALEFPHPRGLSGDAHVLIAAHSAAIAGRAGEWQPEARNEIAKREATLAYRALHGQLEILTEVVQ